QSGTGFWTGGGLRLRRRTVYNGRRRRLSATLGQVWRRKGLRRQEASRVAGSTDVLPALQGTCVERLPLGQAAVDARQLGAFTELLDQGRAHPIGAGEVAAGRIHRDA